MRKIQRNRAKVCVIFPSEGNNVYEANRAVMHSLSLILLFGSVQTREKERVREKGGGQRNEGVDAEVSLSPCRLRAPVWLGDYARALYGKCSVFFSSCVTVNAGCRTEPRAPSASN